MDAKLYIAFGTKNQEAPTVKIVPIIFGDYITETTDGIYSIDVSSYGDDLANPYIEVQAMYQDVASDTWHRVRNSLNTEFWYYK